MDDAWDVRWDDGVRTERALMTALLFGGLAVMAAIALLHPLVAIPAIAVVGGLAVGVAIHRRRELDRLSREIEAWSASYASHPAQGHTRSIRRRPAQAA